MAANEFHFNKRKKLCGKMNRLTLKDSTVVTRPPTDKPMIVLGGVVHVQIKSTRKADGGYALKFKKVTPNTKNSHGVFVAGGSEIDRLVASANASAPTNMTGVPVPQRKFTSFKDYIIHWKLK